MIPAMKIVSFLLAGLLLLLSTGCEQGKKPLMRGEGDGRSWVPGKDGKFMVITLQNSLDVGLLLALDSSSGNYRMQVDASETRYLAVPDAEYTIEVRAKEKDAKLGKYDQTEEVFGGIKRVHLKAYPKPPGDAKDKPKEKAEPSRK